MVPPRSRSNSTSRVARPLVTSSPPGLELDQPKTKSRAEALNEAFESQEKSTNRRFSRRQSKEDAEEWRRLTIRRDSKDKIQVRPEDFGLTSFDAVNDIKEFVPQGSFPLVPENEQGEKMYLDLHVKVSSRSFNSRVAQGMNTAVELIRDSLPFDIEGVARGGSVGNSTAVASSPSATATYFVHNLPHCGFDEWQSKICKAAGRVLDHMFNEEHWTQLKIRNDHVSMVLKGCDLTLKIYFAPYFETYLESLMCLSTQHPSMRPYFQSIFAKESSNFIARQNGSRRKKI